MKIKETEDSFRLIAENDYEIEKLESLNREGVGDSIIKITKIYKKLKRFDFL